jgi:ribosomal protein L37AE/L43A
MERMVTEFWPGFAKYGMPHGTVAGPGLVPFVNHGRWVIQCPECPSCALASKRDARFFCTECSNATAGVHWLPVAWPAGADQIERLLSARSRPANRNWRPGEPLDRLAAENLEHWGV